MLAPFTGWSSGRGPHTVETLDDFFSVMATLRRDQLMALAAAHSEPDPRREQAWASARSIIERDGLAAEVDRLRSEVINWATRPASSPMQWAEILMADGLLEQDVRRAAAPALLDAAVALFLGEALDAADREAMLRPWHGLSGEPELR